MKLEKFPLGHKGEWAVRPEGACGTCGWINGVAWQLFVFPNERRADRYIAAFDKYWGERDELAPKQVK